MARIIVDIPSISGASTLTGYEEKIEAVAIFDVVESAIAGGTPKLSEVALTRYRDRATPAICQAACLGTDLGDVKIYVLRSVGGTVRPYLTYTLTNTMVSRVEFDTAESNGNAFREHGGYSNAFSGRYKGAWYGNAYYQGHQEAYTNVGSNLNADRKYALERARPHPMYETVPGSYTNTELERIWLNTGSYIWTYTPYDPAGTAAGGVEGSWNLSTGMAVGAS